MNIPQVRVLPDGTGPVARMHPRDVLMVSTIRNQSVNAIITPGVVESATRSAVDVIGVTVIRERVPVLRDIRLSVIPGETVTFMGPNGAGKSTLLKCLAGVVRPQRGGIRWFGQYESCSSVVRRRSGFAAHESGLYFELTALENLLFAGRMYGVPEPGTRATELLTDAGLEATANRMVGKLSQGMRQRLAITRAIVHEPELILLDEPFASLDAEGRDWLASLFQQWRAAGRTVCFASHDPRESHGLAERVVSLDRGGIVSIEPTKSVPISLSRSA